MDYRVIFHLDYVPGSVSNCFQCTGAGTDSNPVDGSGAGADTNTGASADAETD